MSTHSSRYGKNSAACVPGGMEPDLSCRLENDAVVFRGHEYEASGQLLRGTVVLCLPLPLEVDNIRLKLAGTLHYKYGINILEQCRGIY